MNHTPDQLDQPDITLFDEVGHRAGAALRRPAPPDGVGAIAARRRSRQRRTAAFAGAAVLVIAVGTLVAISRDGGNSSSPAVTTPPPPTLPPADDPNEAVPVDAGTYLLPASAWNAGDITLTLPSGWTVQDGQVFGKNADVAGKALTIFPMLVDEVFADPCTGDVGDVIDVTAADDLGTLLRALAGDFITGQTATTLGGSPAVRYDLSIPDGYALDKCTYSEFRSVQVLHSAAAKDFFVLFDGADASVYVLEVGGRQQAIVTEYDRSASAADVAELESIVDSLRIAG